VAIDADDVTRARGWLDAVEAALVARAMAADAGPAAADANADADLAGDELGDDVWQLGLSAVAAKFLAVGTPRTLGLVAAGTRARDLLAAQCAYATPRELRVYEPDDGAAAAIAADLASPTLTGRAVTLAQACAADIVVVAAPLSIARAWIRAGTLVTVLDRAATVDATLLAAADVYDRRRIARVAAGLIDGRTLDEITILLA
jgi:hypothetical protein